jgi:hypothetical protein
MFNVIFFFCLAGGAHSAFAESTASSPLQQTQDCLRSQNCEAAKTDTGMATDRKALEAVGGDLTKKQALYDISADIMPILEQQAGGDPAKLQEIMLKAQTDPVGFLNALPAELKAKIKNMATSVK